MDLGIDGRVALVMGASKGIGRGIAGALAAEGAQVAIASRSRERLDATAAELPGDVTGFVADAGDLDAAARSSPPRSRRRSARSRSSSPTPAARRAGGALDNSIEEWEEAYPLAGARRAGAGRRGRSRGCASVAGDGSSTSAPTRRSSRSRDLTLSNSVRARRDRLPEDALEARSPADGITVNTVATGKFATDRLAEPRARWRTPKRSARETVPAGRLGRPGGVRRPGRLPRLRPRRLHHRDDDPDRRRLLRRRRQPFSAHRHRATARRGARASPGR